MEICAEREPFGVELMNHVGTLFGYTAVSSNEALQCIQEVRPDLVLMDIRLRCNTDGLGFGKFSQPHLRVLRTSPTDDGPLQGALAVESVAIVSKPNAGRDLQDAFPQALEQQDAEQ